MEPNVILKNMSAELKKAVDHTLHQFSTLHTGKASPSMLDGIKVNAYGGSSALKEVGAVSTPDARTISVQVWDKSIIQDVEKAIQEANLGFNPIVDGGLLRIPVPELTGERREELAKTAGHMAEEGRVRVRAIRRDTLDQLKAKQKDGLSEDDYKRYEKDVQKEHDKYIAEINEHLTHKEADLKTV